VLYLLFVGYATSFTISNILSLLQVCRSRVGNWIIYWQTNLQSVKSQTMQLVD